MTAYGDHTTPFTKYGAILIDPPWPFKTYTKEATIPTRVEADYACMGLNEIAGLPIPTLAAKNCAVFLWQSDSLSHASHFLAEAWGFKVVTNPVFIWVKPSIGMGYWARKRAECVAMLKRGSPKRLSGGVDQVIEAQRRQHSRKPDEIYERIEALVDGPYLEMFARQRWPGWDQMGSETDKFEAAE